MTDAYERAIRKLHRIIEREGDAGGARLTPAYFLQLLKEEIRQEEYERFFSVKKAGDNS